MKQYTSRELSEKLVKLGCKSHSRFYYGCSFNIFKEAIWDKRPQYGDPLFKSGITRENTINSVPAFEFEDFCGTHEQAHINTGLLIFYIQNKRNSFRREGDQVIVSGRVAIRPMTGEELVLEMIRSEDWLKYLEKVMEEVAA